MVSALPWYDAFLISFCISSALGLPKVIALMFYEKLIPSIYLVSWTLGTVYLLTKYVR